MTDKAKKPNKTATAIVEVGLAHWANTVVTYDRNLYGDPLLDLLPDVPLGHGIKLKVTVEVLSKGRPCKVRNVNDGHKCPKRGK
jgi:hypothetical protein